MVAALEGGLMGPWSHMSELGLQGAPRWSGLQAPVQRLLDPFPAPLMARGWGPRGGAGRPAACAADLITPRCVWEPMFLLSA